MQFAVINSRARARYGQFVSATDMVLQALESADKLIARVDDARHSGGFTVATQDELVGFRRTAFEALESLRGTAKTYEAELVSREWRL